ncbi:hypothetical protein FRC02_004234 [Tulasnella sp. 418]|nr:hypothetical protein FRC02_004234 [Tulasnella sp. 418]
MGRRARMRYLAPKEDGFPERPTSIDFTMGGRIKASPGMSDMAAYLFEAENFYVSGCDGNRTEAERKCADTRYLTTITDWPAGYGPHGPWYMYDTLLKKWVLEEQYDTSEESQYRRWDNYMTLRRLLRYRMDSIEFRKWTKPSDFDSSQENDVPETGLEWVEEFVSPTPEWAVGDVSKKARKAKKDKKKKLPKGCPAFWLDVDEAEMVSDHQADVDLPNQE